MNTVQALSYVASQSISKGGLNSCHLKKENDLFSITDDNALPLTIDDIDQIISESFQQDNLTPDEKRARFKALQCILEGLQQRKEPSFITTLFWHIKGKHYLQRKQHEELVIAQLRYNIDQFCAQEDYDDLASSETEARCQFNMEFKEQFKHRPSRLEKNEALLLDVISKRIWDSKNVQEKPKEKQYEEYKRLMTEFYVGSHMLFEEADDESILELLENQIGPGVEPRFSSHYGKVGDEVQHHIMGKQLPELLFHHGIFKQKKERVIPGSYSKIDLPKDKQFKAFWIQAERTPDGPSRLSWLKHRTVDFVHYFFLKKIAKSNRPQIAKYVGPFGRGVPDSNPIIVRLNKAN